MPNRRKMIISSLSEMALRELWESGTPLDSAWVEFSDGLDDFKLAALRTPPKKYQVIRDDPRYRELEPSLPKTWEERRQELDVITTIERCNLLYEIYVGELWAIGSRTLDNGFDELVRVPRELFFVDPDEGPFHEDVYWAKGQLTTDDDSYFDIRVVQPPDKEDQRTGSTNETETRDETYKDFRSITSPVNDEVEVHEPGRPGRPSKGDLILAAIAEHSNNDPGLTLPKRERFHAYRSYISERGYDSREDGFSDKTIEKYETEFRKKKR